MTSHYNHPRSLPTHETRSNSEFERREAEFMRGPKWYYVASRAIGLAEHSGAFFRGETDEPPEAYFTKHYGTLDDEADFTTSTTRFDKKVAQMHQHIKARRDLMEAAGPLDTETPPQMTVLVPIAINAEKPEMLHELLQKISDRQHEFGGGLQPILWANAHYLLSEDEVRPQAEAHYATLRELATDFSRPDLPIQTALDIMPRAEFSMSKLRQRTMDAFVGLANERNYSPGHVVTWLDADAVFLGHDYFGTLHDQTDSHTVGFVHPRVDYAADWAHGQNKTTYDPATRAFLANEIINRALRAEQTSSFYEYTEESGLTFTYLTLLLSGGCDSSNPLDESESLINGLKTGVQLPVFDTIQALHAGLLGEKLEVARPTDEEVADAHLALSGRRTYDAIKHYGIEAIPTQRQGGAISGDYRLFTLGDHGPEQPLDPVRTREYLEARRQELQSEVSRRAITRVLNNLYPR